jgi:hypothetical protein
MRRKFRGPIVDPNEPYLRQIDNLLARVELLQQTIAQLYLELQAHRQTVQGRADAPPMAEPAVVPLATPASYLVLRPVDRRASPRRQANQILISITSALDSSKPFSGWVLDYSAMGLGLFVDKKVALGTFLNIRPHQSTEKAIWREAEVKNSQQYLDGWRLGCQLDTELTPEDLRRFGLVRQVLAFA